MNALCHLPPPSLCSLTAGVRVLVVSEGVPGAGPGHGEVVHVVEHVPGHRAVLESKGVSISIVSIENLMKIFRYLHIFPSSDSLCPRLCVIFWRKINN